MTDDQLQQIVTIVIVAMITIGAWVLYNADNNG